jgi:hypothetical protein
MTLLSKAEQQAHGFRAVCNLSRAEAVSSLPHYLRREYDEKGYRKGVREIRLKSDWRRVECYLIPLCDGFETTDRAAFEEHMKKVHGKANVYGHHENWSKSIRRGWVSPKTKPEGAALTKTLAAQVETCPDCGLSAEVGERYGDKQWWNEHLRGCGVLHRSAS